MALGGTVAPGFEPVRDAFAEVVAGQPAPAQRSPPGMTDAGWPTSGRLRRLRRSRPWTRDSIVMPYSVTKPFAALAALVLVDQGLIDLDAPVQRWWPEEPRGRLGAAGALADRARGPRRARPASQLLDWDALCTRLADEEPLWRSGAAIDSAVLGASAVGRAARMAAVGQFLREEVCGPHWTRLRHRPRRRRRLRAVDLTRLEAPGGPGRPGRPDLLRRALFETRPGCSSLPS